MPRNKDLKKLIRVRMEKTGESYTTARAVLVTRGLDASPYAAPRTEWPTLAGASDAAVEKATGRTWSDWIAVLDAADAWERSHADIARHIAETHPDVGGWWAQTVTVGYERIRGLRDVGQRRGGSYDANKSRTFPVDVSTLFGMFADPARRAAWLPESEGVERVRTAAENKSMRCDWHDGTRVHLYFTAKGPVKSSVSVQHGKLATKDDVETAKALWHSHLDALSAALAR